MEDTDAEFAALLSSPPSDATTRLLVPTRITDSLDEEDIGMIPIVVSQFQSLTGCSNADVDNGVANQFLDMSDNNLERAVELFAELREATTTEANENDEEEDEEYETGSDCYDISLSSPNYDYLGMDEDDLSTATELVNNLTKTREEGGIDNKEREIYISTTTQQDKTTAKKQLVDDEYYDNDEDDVMGEEYILGTMMVRVLQARNVQLFPNQDGGIGGFLLNHRRNRQQQQQKQLNSSDPTKKPTKSPASGAGGVAWDGNLTPSSPFGNPQLYAILSYQGRQTQPTTMAVDHSISGEYHWSRSDQTYFDITCPAYPLTMNNKSGSSNNKGRSSSPSIVKKPPKKQRQSSSSKRRPILQLSLYSKRSIDKLSSGKGGKGWGSNNTKKNVSIIKDDDEFLGKCSINVLQILCGKTPYFDEWCTIHNNTTNNNKENTMTGRVRIVIEYDPTDPPPRYGDTCVFANVYPLGPELYPIAPYTIRNSTSITGRKLSTIIKRPKPYRVEEVVGDNVILSYQTLNEGWQCTFEVHRYLLLCVERHQPSMEKYREQIMDLVDNVSQSPAVEEITKTIERLPEEGLVHVGTDIVEHTVDLLGRWWETGLDCMVEDIVNSTNLDGRYTQFISDDDDHDNEEEENEDGDGKVQIIPQSYQYEASSEGKKALQGMPCCPITGQPMIEPVVAADGHTYERYAIARWMETSKISPLTGEELFHNKLVPNYLLLSSLGNAEAKEEVDDDDDDDDDENLPGGTRPDAMNSIGQFDVL